MKWTNEQIEDLKALCLDGTKNSEIAEYFGVPVTEIHAKRSQLGITIPKIDAMKAGTVSPELENAPKTAISRLNWLKQPARTAGEIADFIGSVSGCPHYVGSNKCVLEDKYGNDLGDIPDTEIDKCCNECMVNYLLGDMEAGSK
jgi:hypothetical protein